MASILDRNVLWSDSLTGTEDAGTVSLVVESVGGGYCLRCRRRTQGRFCGECGNRVADQVASRCRHCGSETRARFCPQCGKPTRPEKTAPTPAPIEDLTRHIAQRARQTAAATAVGPVLLPQPPKLSGPSAALPELPCSREVFRQLSVALDLCADRRVVVGVTSAIAGEGRTTCAAALARTVAEDASSPVLLVEADLQRPALASYFNLPTGPGLADVLRGSCSLPAAIQSGGENLFVVTAGTPGDDLASLMLELPNLDPVRACSWVTGAVILDLPPILNHGYSPEAARLADDVVLVARAGITPVEALREALARLGERPPVGVVLNGQTSSIPASLASLFPS